MKRFASLILAVILAVWLPAIALAESDCTDGLDNDGDLLVDCQDPDCDLLACDDGLACNVGETCQSGSCAGGGAPDCSGTGDQCNADSTCDPAGVEGNCAVPGGPINEGLACDDGLACNVGETCQSGSCAGGGPPDCSGTGDQCNADSTCDPAGAEGNCAVPGGTINEGLACDDGLACNVGETCQLGSCAGGGPLDCDNGLFCDGAETCDDVSGCQPGTPPTIDDGVPCTDDSCDEVNDVIVNTANDANCDDGAFCNGAETCDAVLNCQAGTPPVTDDGVSCTNDSCDETNDVVVNTPNDALCDNGLFCDGAETCDALLDCMAGTPPVIDDGIPCTNDSCDEVNDVVVHAPVDLACSNGFFCDGPEVCNPVVGCEPGTPPVVDDGVFCTDDACNEALDQVVHVANNANCDNGQFCDGSETCDLVLDCQAGTPPVTDDGVACTDDSCDEVNNVIVNTPNDANCDDGAFCNGAETCDAVLNCQAGTPPVTDDGVSCTNDSCDETNDVVVNTPNDALCDNGLFCDGAETCDALLDCMAGTPPVIDDGVFCTDDLCDETNDVVVNTANDANCDNGQFCDGAETCDALLDCQPGTAPGLDDGVACTIDACDDVTGTVTHTPSDALCDDGAFCNGAETCDAVLDCQAGTPPAIDDGVGCTDDSCDEVGDVVVNTANNANCDDGAFCNGAETCNAITDCQPGTPPAIDDGIPCTTDSCDEAGDVVVHAPLDIACSNGLFCDGAEVCNPAIGCEAGAPPVVDDGVFCTDDACNEALDVVTHTANDTYCNNLQFCDGVETCDAVLDCQAGTPPVLDDGVACTDDFCDEIGNVVIHTPNNTNCDNGQFCDGAEVCNATTDCQPGPPPTIDDGVSCTDDSCDEVNDVIVNALNDALCDNGAFCDGAETCSAVFDCLVGTPPTVDDGVGCTVDSCDEVNDVVVNAPSDALCDNGLFCDGAETCDVLLDCQAGTAPGLDDGVACTIDACDDVTGVVTHTPSDVLCDDGAFCNGAETCDALLDCQAGTAPVIDDGVACTNDTCDEANDIVVHTPSNANCDDGAFCNGAEVCHPLLDCQAGVPPAIDDGVACTADSCDEVNDVVVNTPLDPACSNGFFCDGAEVCNPATGCEPGTPPVVDDGVACTDDACNEALDVVVHNPNNAFCDNGVFCDGAETCDVVLDCQPGTAPGLDDGVACTIDTCDDVTGTVVHTPSDAFCDDSAYCNGAETCDAVLDCQAGTAPVVDDGVGCTNDFCDETNDQVVNIPNNALCDDSLFCNGTETCDAVLDCQNGTPPVVDDGVVCTVDSCDEANDVVVHAPNSALCDDGAFCNGAEICNVTTDCQPGTPPVINDGVSCTDDSCDEVNDVVINNPNNANCSDGAFCNGAEACNPISDCQAGTPPPLNDGISCTVDTCDETNDVVLHTPNDAICSDGAFCNGPEICDPLADCQVGVPPVVNDGVSCTTDVCDELNDVVTHTPSNAFCDNSVFCDGAEICHPLLDCLAGAPPLVDDGVVCTVDSCDEVNDVVVNAPNNAACDDGTFCNGAEICNPLLDCQAGAPPVINDGVDCTVDSCDEVNDVVVHAPNNGFCDDGAFCNGAETCDPVNDCQPGPGLNCNDGIGCTVDSCNDVTNACVNTPNNTICDDTLFCNGAEICDVALDCQPGTPPVINDGIGCTDDACDEVNNVVVHVANNANCDNATFCDGAETCSPLFDCQPGIPPVVDDGIACTDDSCDEINNVVVHAPNNSLCDDGAFCNGAEVCNTSTGCSNGPPPVCNDFVLCTSDTCDPFANACSHIPNDGICDNGILCDGAEFCDPVGGCQVGTEVDCDDAIDCTVDDCDVLLDACTHDPVDSVCDDGLFCTGAEVCTAGVGCEPGVPISCADLVSCTVDTCDEATMGCISTPDDTLCDNGLFCDGDETCDAGLDCQPGGFVNCSGATVGCQLGFCNESIDSCDTLGQSNLCQDGLYCNGSEVCNAAGGCDPGVAVDCSNLSTDCSVGTCDEGTRACTFSPINEGQPCDDGDFCTTTDFCVQGVCGAGATTTCGDGFIDTSCGEVCDPPAAEVCNSTIDLDGDGLIGCLDPDCCNSIVPLCGGDCRFVEPCKTISSAPGTIRLKSTGMDMLKLRGRVAVNPLGLNPVEDGFGIALSNSSGIVYEANLLPGDFIARAGSFGRYKWRDRAAKTGQGVRNGLYQVRSHFKQINGEWLYLFKVKAYADLNSAVESDMAVQVFGVDDVAVLTAPWTQRRSGWKLSESISNGPVFACQ